MRTTIAAIASLLVLAACQGADARFDRSFELAEGEAERCRVATEATEYFLREGNEAALEKWRSKRAFPCLAARAGRW